MKKKMIAVLSVFIFLLQLFVGMSVTAEDMGYKNVALGANTITNSEYSASYAAEKLVDGIYSTNYSATASVLYADAVTIPDNDKYVVIDLGNQYNIYGMKIYSRRDTDQSASHRSNWIVQGTNDPSLQTWTTIDTISYVGEFGSVWELNFDEPIQYRYIKPGTIQSNGKMNAVALAEAEIYGEKAVLDSASMLMNDIDENSSEYNHVNFVTALKIIEPVSKNDFGRDYLLTRKECAKIISLCINNQTGILVSENESFFDDVDKSSEFAPYINICKLRGIVAEAQNFEPDRYIYVQEFVKMIMCAMGYESYAQFEGGYANGYMNIASSLDILPRGISPYDNLTRINAAEIIYNAMLTPVMSYVGNGDFKTSEENFLESSYGYTLNKGIVMANNVSNLQVIGGVGRQNVQIGDTVYQDPENSLNQLLGYSVYYIVDEELSIVSSWKDNRTKVHELEVKDIYEVNDGTISYYSDETKIRKYKFEGFNKTYILKNGVAYNDYTIESFQPDDGRLELIDNNNDGTVDVIHIWEPKVMVVNYLIDEENHIYINDFNNNGINIYDYTNMYVYRDGKAVSTDSVVAYSLVYAYISENEENVILEVCNKRKKGTVSSMSEDEIITVDTTEYELADYFISNKSKLPLTIEINKEITFLINSNDEIVWAVNIPENRNSELLSVIIKVIPNEVEDYCLFKVFTENGKTEKLYTANKVQIDGSRHTVDSIKQLLNSNDEYFSGLVYIKTNAEKKITSIKTCNDSSERTLCKSFELKSGYYKNNTCFSYQGNMVVPLAGDISVITVPVDGSGKIINSDAYDKYFSVGTINSIYGQGTRVIKRDIDLYGKGEYGEPYYAIQKYTYSDMFDGTRPLTVETDNTLLLEKSSVVLNSDDEITYSLEGVNLFTGEKIKAELNTGINKVVDSYKICAAVLGTMDGDGDKIKKWYDGVIDQQKAADQMIDFQIYCDDVANLKQGDILKYSIKNGVIDELERIYSVGEINNKLPYDILYSLNDGVSITYVSKYRLAHRYVEEINSEIIKLATDENVETIFYGNMDAKVYTFDGRVIEKRNINELPSHTVGGNDVVSISTSGKYRSFVIYTNE